MTSPAKLATGKIPFKAKQAQPLALSSLSPRFFVQRFFRFSTLSNPPFAGTHVKPTPEIRSVRSFEANESHRNRRKIVFSHEFNFTNGFPSPNFVFLSCHLLRSCCDSPHDEVWAIDKKMLHPSESAKDRNENYILFIFHHIFPHFPISSHSLGPHRARLLCIYSVGFAKAEIYSQRRGDGGEAPIKRRRRRLRWRCASQFAFWGGSGIGYGWRRNFKVRPVLRGVIRGCF